MTRSGACVDGVAQGAGRLLWTYDDDTVPVVLSYKGELRDFQRFVTESGRATFAARVGQHDDLVLAVALAAWWLRARPQPGRRFRVNWV